MRIKQENPPIKERILDAAQQLMMLKGFAGTSVDAVCVKAAVTKGNFFYYFKTKDALGMTLLNRFSQNARAGFCCAASGAGADPLDKIYACLDYMENAAGKPGFQGCLVGTFSQESESLSEEMRGICSQSFKASVELFRKDLQEAWVKYAPKVSFTAKDMADFLLSSIQGSFILMKAQQGDRKIVASNIKLMRAYLKTVFGR